MALTMLAPQGIQCNATYEFTAPTVKFRTLAEVGSIRDYL